MYATAVHEMQFKNIYILKQEIWGVKTRILKNRVGLIPAYDFGNSSLKPKHKKCVKS